MKLFWSHIRNLFVKKPSPVLKLPVINLDDDAVFSEYKELLSSMCHLLKKYNDVEALEMATQALDALETKNNKRFIELVTGNGIWGGACSVCDFRFYFPFIEENGKDEAKKDQKHGDMILYKLSRMLLRDGVQSPRIEADGQWHAQRAKDVDSY